MSRLETMNHEGHESTEEILEHQILIHVSFVVMRLAAAEAWEASAAGTVACRVAAALVRASALIAFVAAAAALRWAIFLRL